MAGRQRPLAQSRTTEAVAGRQEGSLTAAPSSCYPPPLPIRFRAVPIVPSALLLLLLLPVRLLTFGGEEEEVEGGWDDRDGTETDREGGG